MALGRVFVSSVFGGMLDLRQAAAAAVRLAGLDPVLTENLVAQPSTVQAALQREIEGCDTYLGLFDRRQGTVPPTGTPDHRAITEEEFRLARELGLRCLVFLSRDGAPSREPGLAEFLEREVGDYATGVWARPYDTSDSLRREIVAAVSAVRPRMALSFRGGEARLFLGGVKPAWTGEAVLGPAPVDLALRVGARGVFDAFRRGMESRNRLQDGDLHVAGGDLASRALPGPLGEALAQVLDLAGGQLVTLEIRTREDADLALPWELLSLRRHPLPVREGKIEIVRRLLLPGDPEDPARDPAPSVPPAHLDILGFTAAPVEDQDVAARPGAGGLGDSDLFWEREQERLLAALHPLLRERRGRLILPDTGDKEELRKQFFRLDRPHVVHISCHGGTELGSNGSREPALFLENGDGFRAPLLGTELLSWVNAVPSTEPPALLVLSACSTSGQPSGDASSGPGFRGQVAESVVVEAPGLAERLLRGGLPRVLGMQSTVSDAGATAFAGGLYSALGRGIDLGAALRAGRAELAAHGGPHEWAIPTLTLRRDAGPLAAPEGSAPSVPLPFETAEEIFRIAGVSYLKKGYVGRRDAERRLRRAFDRGDKIIVLHGLGGIGKSTLAARFLARRQSEGARVLTLYAGHVLAPAALLDEVAMKLAVARPVGLPPEAAEARFREALAQALQKVEPTLLLLDNFEDNQTEDGRLRDPALGAALLDLVRLGDASLRLLLTTRLAVTLPPGPIEPFQLDLGELSPSGCRKLRILDPDGLGRLKDDVWQQVLVRLGGHPKALELLGGYLRGRPDRARSLVRQLDEAIQVVGDRLSATGQERGRSLLIEAVLKSVPPARRPAFDRLCLLTVPLPSEELEALLADEGLLDPGADLSWLRDHGLLASTVSPSALTGGGDLVHRLLADRQRTALADREGEEAARSWHLRVADHLVERPGSLSDLGAAASHRDAAGNRAGALELYNRWAIKLRNHHAYATCVQIAREGLQRFSIRELEAERVGAARLWLRIHDAFIYLGKIREAEGALEEALGLLRDGISPEARFHSAGVLMLKGRLLLRLGRSAEAEAVLGQSLEGFAKGGHKRERAVVSADLARLREQAGDISGALKLYEEMLGIFESLGDVRERAVMLGGVARLRAQAGDVSGALKLYEEMLGVFESFGDVRERAVTLGDVARLRAQSGDVLRALKLHEERLGIAESLGDVETKANAQFEIAGIHLTEGRKEAAQANLLESWKIVSELGHVQAIAVVGSLCGQLLLSTDPTQAVTILRTARDAFQRLGQAAEAAKLDALLPNAEQT